MVGSEKATTCEERRAVRELKISIQVHEGNVQFCGGEVERPGGGVERIVFAFFLLRVPLLVMLYVTLLVYYYL